MAGGKVKAVRKHVKNKGKRWKKGQSSSSNPQAKKFRNEAKNRFFNQNTGPSNLTVDALNIHNQHQADEDDDLEMLDDAQSIGRKSAFTAADDAQSIGGKTALTANTFSTWASNWTECTNRTFGRVHRYWSSNTALHKEILAVLAAITEVIKSQDGRESETEYFAALMTTLDTVDSEDSLAAVAYLLSLAIKRVPAPVLKTRFSDVSKSLMNIMAQHANSDTPALLRSVLVCVASLLRVQEQAAWSNTSTTTVFSALLTFTVHCKPKVRKAAQHAVAAILKGSVFMSQGEPPSHHPAAVITAKFCVQQIEECGGMGEASKTLHTLGLLKDVMYIFPRHSLKSTCEAILRVMTLSNVLVTAVAMSALHSMFICQPKPGSLPADLNAQLITALYDYQPGENDAQPLCAWLAVMHKSHSHLSSLDADLCLSHLPRLFSSCVNAMKSQKANVTSATANCLTSLLKECLTPLVSQIQISMATGGDGSGTSIHKMFSLVSGGLSYQFHMAWGHVLKVIAVFFEVVGKECHKIMKKCLQSMADLRDSHRFAYTAELDHAVGVAIQHMGPRVVLSAVPLQITGENDDLEFPRSWLLPVLRNNIKHTQLAYFTEYFLPLAAKLRNKYAELTDSGEMAAAKAYETLQLQIWSLLAGFCNKPTDLAKSFRGIARILGSALTERPDLRMDILTSLRKIVAHSLEDDESKGELSRFSKNYLPILFNLFTTELQESDRTRLAVLETIKVFLQVTPPELIATFYEKCSSKLTDDDVGATRKHALMDLCICMVPHIQQEHLVHLSTVVVSQLNSSDKTIQKKSYRVLEELCRSQSSASKEFITSHLKELQNVLLTSLSTASPSSKAPRLRCLIHIFKQLDKPQGDFLIAVIPEALLCTKETAERARTAAFNLLVEMGNATIRWSERARKGAVQEYVEFMFAGFTGETRMVSSTALGLGHVLHEYKDDVSSELMALIIEQLNMLLTSKAREVVTAAISLVKIIVTVFKDIALGQFVESLVSSLVSMKQDNKHHLRFKTKEIFERLVRKFGYETIHRMVPESMQKVLANIRKTQERVKRKKKQHKDDEDGEEEENILPVKSRSDNIDDLLRDTDSELEEDEGEAKNKRSKVNKKTKRPMKTGAAWLKESGDGDIVDFLDASVSKKVLASKPEDRRQKKTEELFKMSADGKLIITDDAEEDGVKKGQKRKKKEDPILDDVDEILDAMAGGKKSKKRKSLTDEDEGDEPVAKYKAGGSGIHRPLDKADVKESQKKEVHGEEYRAKKAGGDLKKKGKHEPYAYVPLNMQNLNKRKQAKAAGMFSHLVKGAKRGAAKGRGKRQGKKGAK